MAIHTGLCGKGDVERDQHTYNIHVHVHVHALYMYDVYDVTAHCMATHIPYTEHTHTHTHIHVHTAA